ncbi:hypothetical protein [Pararhodonellum marinum]|uniref:hypothetical protein n=1 Tax=Pararhodonellum marinum TaxID=2755358 RepID=UPI00188FE286|nr:hypothetical protein [Pararhodonellum marinum]
MNSQKLTEEKNFYNRYLVVFVESQDDFRRWDFDNYEHVIMNQFNHLENIRFRGQLFRSLKRNLAPAVVLDTDELFPVHNEVSYMEFKDAIEQSGVDAILFVHLKTYYEVFLGSTSEPRAVVNSFLIETKNYENVWVSNAFLRGELYAGYDVLNNHYARKISKALRQEGLLLPNPTTARY